MSLHQEKIGIMDWYMIVNSTLYLATLCTTLFLLRNSNDISHLALCHMQV